MSKYHMNVPAEWEVPEGIFEMEIAPSVDEDGAIEAVILNMGDKIYTIDPMEIMSLANTLQALYPYLHVHASMHPDLIIGTGVHAPVEETPEEPEAPEQE